MRPPPTFFAVRTRSWDAIRAITLVEFLGALVFVSALLALALPRLWNASSEARAAKQQAIFGSVRAAAQITRAAARVHDQLGSSGSVEVDGTRISTVFGYPAASAAGIIAATGLDAVNDQFSLTDGSALAGGSITIALNDARGTCAIVYTAPVTAEAQPKFDLINHSDQGNGTGC